VCEDKLFVRRKTVKGNSYYQLVQNYREAGKHKQKVLCHLGQYRSIEAAIEAERELAEEYENEAVSWAEAAQFTKENLFKDYGEELGNVIPSRQQAHFRWRAFWKEYRQKYLKPYDRWYFSRPSRHRIDMDEYSLWERRLEEQRAPEREVWEKRRQLWDERAEVEEDLILRIDEYHYEVSEARRHEKQGAFHRRELNKFLEAKQKHCS
jgi:hypothetical protein